MTTAQPNPDQAEILVRLTAYLSDQMGAPVQIIDAQPLAGGASRDSWRLNISAPGHPDGDQQSLVMRRDLASQMFDDALTREQEYRLMAAAYDNGVQVARMRYLCTDKMVLGSDFFLMDYRPGISVGTRVLRLPELAEARARLPQQMAAQLARIHQIDTAAHDLDFLPRPPAGVSPAKAVVEQVYAILDGLGVHNPAWEWSLRWAQRHAPDAPQITFVHGDFRLGNWLVTEDGLSAVIDWEFGHMGDPDEELGYVCMRDWRFGNGAQRFAGLSDRETFLRAYEATSGRQVDRAAVDWWEIMGNIRWGVICLSQAQRHLSGADPSVELASLGRRSAEMQLETLRLIAASGL